jgi:sec-independent protein translocase protein TatA
MFPSLGMPELLIIGVVALIVFGPRKLPELGRSLGKSLQEFRRATNELKHTLDEEISIEERKEERKIEAPRAAVSTNPADISVPTPSTGSGLAPADIESPAAPETIARGHQ